MAPKKAREAPAVRRPTSAIAVVSEYSPETATACWEIRGYSLIDKSKTRLSSNSLIDNRSGRRSPPIVEVAGARFCLLAFFGGVEEKDDKGYFSIGCEREEGPGSDKAISVRIEIHVIGTGQARMVSGEMKHDSFKEECVVCHNFGKIATLESPTYLVDDSVIIELSVTAWMGEGRKRVRKLPAAPDSSGSTAPGDEDNPKQGTLARDLAAFLAGGSAADVEVGGGENGECVVKAHRVVLAARSPVFDSMLLKSGMRESSTGARIPLDGVDRPVVEQFVRFLYTDELDQGTLEDPDAVCHLLALGHRYEVHALSRACAGHVTITEDTAIERLVMAEQFGVASLKEQVLDYVCSTRARLAKVRKTEAFARMSKNHPQLMVELFARATEPAGKRARMSEVAPS